MGEPTVHWRQYACLLMKSPIPLSHAKDNPTYINFDALLTKQPEVIRRVLSRYREIMPDCVPPCLPPRRILKVELRLRAGCTKPRPSPPYRHLASDAADIERQLGDLFKAGLITPVACEPHAAQLVPAAFLVDKKGTTKRRLVIDYRAVNEVLEVPPVILPDTRVTLDVLRGARFYATLDLRSAFWQLLL